MGPRRSAAVRAVLAQMLDTGRGRRRPAAADGVDTSVETLLDVDREYRERATRGDLPKIAPRRFNPAGDAWLPVLHTRRGPWHLTALYSNTARAHELGREHDWVVVYAYDGDHRERQHTVVTEIRGPLTGRRVVRGLIGVMPRVLRASDRAVTAAGPRPREQPTCLVTAGRPAAEGARRLGV